LIGLLAGLMVADPVSAVPILTGDCPGPFPQGDGSLATPYIVTTSAQLAAIDDDPSCLDENFRQDGDIALSGTWTPIGDFVGSYDGGRHSITELQLSGSDAGLFNVGASGATFSRLSISVTTSASTGSKIGALVGLSSGPLSITDVHIRGDVISRGCCGSSVGGVVGEAGSTVNVSGSSVTGNVSAASSYVGGVVGYAPAGAVTVSSTTITGNVSSTGCCGSSVGGVVGDAGSTVDVSGSSVTGNVSAASSYVGGVAGKSTGAVTVSSTVVEGNVSSTGGSGSHVGGLVGNASSTVNVSGSSVTGDVSAASSYVGGVVGKSTGGVTVSSTTVTGNVTSTAGHASGGLVGEAGSTVDVSGSSVTGDVSGAGSYAGGAAGHAGGAVTVTAMSFVGTVTSTGAGEVGGFVGRGESTVDVSGSSVTGDVTAAGNYAGGVVGTAFFGEVTIGTTAVVGDVLLTVGGWVGGLVAEVSSLVATDSFYYGTVITPNPSAGGIAGKVRGNTTLSRVYVAGSRPSPAVTDQSGFVGQQGGSLGVTNSFCTGLDCSLRALDTDLKSQSFLEGFGWDFDTVWCVSSSTNGGYPVLRAITFPAAGFAPCWTPVVVVAPSLPMTPIWRVALDPNDGGCREGKTIRNEKWQSVFVGYRYLPGKDDCERDGFTFEGWADADQPDEVRQLPLLVDPTDGVKRAFLASNADLVAVWKEADEADGELDDLTGTAPGAFVGGVDRPTREGGGVVDGYYIPPRTDFGPWMLAK